MKRNWTALALALGLTLTLTACGGNPGAAETPGSAAPTGSQTPAAESDLDYVKGNGVLKIGYTLFEPMNYLGEDGELTGFETEFATAVCAKLGVEPKFVEINWDAKLLELESKNIDCIWNGMTITPESRRHFDLRPLHQELSGGGYPRRRRGPNTPPPSPWPAPIWTRRPAPPVRRRLRPTSSSARPAIPLW